MSPSVSGPHSKKIPALQPEAREWAGHVAAAEEGKRAAGVCVCVSTLNLTKHEAFPLFKGVVAMDHQFCCAVCVSDGVVNRWLVPAMGEMYLKDVKLPNYKRISCPK